MDEWIACDTRTSEGQSCPARALVHVNITGKELHFCGHHGDKYMPRLLEVADDILDDRGTVYTCDLP